MDTVKKEIVKTCHDCVLKRGDTDKCVKDLMDLIEYYQLITLNYIEEIKTYVDQLFRRETARQNHKRCMFYSALKIALNKKKAAPLVNAMVDIIHALHDRVQALESRLLPAGR